MIRIRRLPTRRLVVLSALTGVLLLGSAFTNSYFEVSKNLEIFTGLYQQLNTYYVDETQPGELMKTGIDAMLKSLDPYTVYYPETRIEDFRFQTTGVYGGIGALVLTRKDRIIITEPREGYAAAKAGLLAGDEILEVDGKSVVGRTQEEMSGILKGTAGSEITLKIKRPGQEATLDFTFEREEVKVKDVPYAGMLDETTGYVSLRKFTKTASSEVRKAIKDLEGQGMQRLVFDLRGNGGGLLREAINIVNFFVPKGTEIVSTRGKLQEWNRTYTALNEPILPDMPVAVLIDGSSASASEIVSGALQDLDRAVVIGKRSFGKGLVQQTKDVAYNSKLKLTVAKYYTPSGRCIQKLDYSNKVDGIVGEVPDSLIQSFTTTSGRKVFDGRGVDPDVPVDYDESINIIGGLLSNDILFDFATDYRLSHESITDAEAFGLSDAEYADFVEYANAQDFEYNTETEALFAQLERVADRERYKEGAEAQFAALREGITPRKSEDLEKFKFEIRELLESEIASRYYFQTGRIQANLEADPVMEAALNTLNTNYADILVGPGK
ncbi:MAG: S41 family peptidase [Flavobacteriales bacterium]